MNNGNDGSIALGFAIIGILIVLYLVPSIIAWRRGHAQKTAIIWTNILLGWTFLGWVAAFIWSLTNPQVIATQPNVNTQSYIDTYDSKVCPQCAESVKRAAQVCRHCGWKF